MKLAILTGVSAIVLMSMTPAVAETNVDAGANATVNTSVNNDDTYKDRTLEKTWNSVKETTAEAKNEVTAATKETYEDVKFSLFGPDANTPSANVSLNARMTADGMIGEPVFNTKNERIGTLKDIIIDENAMAQMVVVSDAEFVDVGVNKEAAFDYNLVTKREPEGDLIMPLTEEVIDNARSFTYDLADSNKEGVRVMPANGLSVDKMLKADIIDAENNKVASVDNVTFKGGRADKLVVGFDKVMGMGGDMAALPLSDVKTIRDGDNIKFQLSATQAAQFETMKQKASN